MRNLLLLLVLAVSASGCSDKEFKCSSGRQCIDRYGASGLCLDTHCAFYDVQCPSGYKWDDAAGELSGMCVEAALLPDAGRPTVDAQAADAR